MRPSPASGRRRRPRQDDLPRACPARRGGPGRRPGPGVPRAGRPRRRRCGPGRDRGRPGGRTTRGRAPRRHDVRRAGCRRCGQCSGPPTWAGPCSPVYRRRELALTSDAIISHAGAFSGGAGAVVAIGTGAVAIGLGSRGLVRVDGLGYWLGDDGGGSWIGRPRTATRICWTPKPAEAPATSLLTPGRGEVRRPRAAARHPRGRRPGRRGDGGVRRGRGCRRRVRRRPRQARSWTPPARPSLGPPTAAAHESGTDLVAAIGGLAPRARGPVARPPPRRPHRGRRNGLRPRRSRAPRGAGRPPRTEAHIVRLSGGGGGFCCVGAGPARDRAGPGRPGRPGYVLARAARRPAPCRRGHRARCGRGRSGPASPQRSPWPKGVAGRWSAPLRRGRSSRPAGRAGRRRDPTHLRHRPEPGGRHPGRGRRGRSDGGRRRRGPGRGRSRRRARPRTRALRPRRRDRGVRPDAVRPRGPARLPGARYAHRRDRQQPGERGRGRRRRRHRAAHRPGGVGRVDPDEGRHRTEVVLHVLSTSAMVRTGRATAPGWSTSTRPTRSCVAARNGC